MSGEINELLNVIKSAAVKAVNAQSPMDYLIGRVVSAEYEPLRIASEGIAGELEEDDLILTKAVQDHWLDIEVYWETVDDNDLSEFQANHYSNITIQNSNVAIHNANSERYNSHTHTNGNLGSPTGTLTEPGDADKPVMMMTEVANQMPRHTSHLHNIQGRKRIRVYNGLHPGEVVLLLRCAGGQQYIVLDRLSRHIVGGEWRVWGGAVTDTITENGEARKPIFEVSEEMVLRGWKPQEEVKDGSKWPRFGKPAKHEIPTGGALEHKTY